MEIVRGAVWGFLLHGLMTLLYLLPGAMASAWAGEGVFLDEQFDSLSRWKPYTFPGIATHSSYSLDQHGKDSCLLMETRAGASALILQDRFNVYAYPNLSWRWKVSNIYRKGDSGSRDGDDYPARIYVLFSYDPEQASLGKKLQYEAARLFFGAYPPDSSINYIWANREDAPPVITNVFTEQAKMIPVNRGEQGLGAWQEFTVNMVDDYFRAFQRMPPAEASLAVMIDADNTGESATACIGFLRIFR